MALDPNDKEILRRLARRVREIAELSIQRERVRLWKKLNRLAPERPMILVFPEGSWSELIPDQALECRDKEARRVELALRKRVYQHERLRDDMPIEKEWLVPVALRNSGWGLEPQWDRSHAAKGARRFHPVILAPADLKRLRYPEVTVDDAATQRQFAFYSELFGDILDVRRVGVKRVDFHLMNRYTALRGLEQVMLDMVAEPEMLHEAMAFFDEGHRRIVARYIELNLLELNNNATYNTSGGVSYTDELPPADCDPTRVRPRDMWGFAEAQELTSTSPEQHEEFCLAYERRLLAPFGLTGYGCCEDLTRKFDLVFTIPRLRRLSISPFTNVEVAADKLQGNYIFSWKPQPMQLVGEFNADRVRRYIQHTLDATQARNGRRGCVLEMILKDTHTCEHHPERFEQWVQIARGLIGA